MKFLLKLAREATVLGQLGFSLVTPPVILALLGWWITERFGLGAWVMAIAILLGILTSAASAWRFWKRYQASAGKQAQPEQEKERSVVYFRHE